MKYIMQTFWTTMISEKRLNFRINTVENSEVEAY